MTEQQRDPPPKPRGRPRGEPHTTVSVWVSARVHDELIARAKRRDESLSATIRALLPKSPRA